MTVKKRGNKMIKYSIIESQGKVVARIDNCAEDVIRLIAKKAGIVFDTPELLLKNSYKGVAKCHPEDVFDVEEGKKIAKAKLIEKYNMAFNKALMSATDMLYIMSNDVADLEDKYCK